MKQLVLSELSHTLGEYLSDGCQVRNTTNKIMPTILKITN